MEKTPEQRIAQLETELAAQRAEMKDFTYTVSHDLRASLRHILSYAHLVQEDAGPQLSDEVQGFVATITDSARHMGVLMDGLMELSRLGTVEVNWGPVDLQQLVQEAVATVQDKPSARAIDWQIGTGLPIVQGDPALLRQALGHVLDNAVKFTQPVDLPRISIDMGPEHGDKANHVVLEIRDNGVGYNPALQAKLFHAFQRLHSVKQFPGIGMGLALTRKIIERQGGTVNAQGVVDGGCVITVLLQKT
jgi:signal transduction histidine kinase